MGRARPGGHGIFGAKFRSGSTWDTTPSWGRGLGAWPGGSGCGGSREGGMAWNWGRMHPALPSLGPLYLTLSPFPGVHSLRVARGKKVGEAEVRGPGRMGRLEGEILSSLTPYPRLQKYFIIMQSVFYPTSRISER